MFIKNLQSLFVTLKQNFSSFGTLGQKSDADISGNVWVPTKRQKYTTNDFSNIKKNGRNGKKDVLKTHTLLLISNHVYKFLRGDKIYYESQLTHYSCTTKQMYL